jgi:hypothetical protein
MSEIYNPGEGVGTAFGGGNPTDNIESSDNIFSQMGSVEQLTGPMSSTSAFNAASGGLDSVMNGVGQLLSASSYRQEAHDYDTAASETAWELPAKQFEMGTKIAEIMGSQRSQLGAAGFTGGGSGQYLQKQATEAGGEAQGQISQNAELSEEKYEQQAKAANLQAEHASAGGIGGILSGIVKIASAFI